MSLRYTIVPLIFPGLDSHALFIVACSVTAITLFVMGAIKVRKKALPIQAPIRQPLTRSLFYLVTRGRANLVRGIGYTLAWRCFCSEVAVRWWRTKSAALWISFWGNR